MDAGAQAWLPAFNTSLIVVRGVCLALGYFFIRQRRIQAHHRSMITATVFAFLFLVVYVYRWATLGSHPFGGSGFWRALYFGILVPHTVLAIVVGPLALITLWRAFAGNFLAHRKIARVTLPIWAFVALSGWVIYILLYVVEWPS
jgi:putative membrane protein